MRTYQAPSIVSARPPALFRLAKYLIRKRFRGGWRLLSALKNFGLLPPAKFALSPDVQIEVPLARVPMDSIDLANYEVEFHTRLSELISQLPSPVTLVDCGADIGLFSLSLASKCSAIRRIIAFEPNPEGFVWLQRNLRQLPFSTESRPEAVSNFDGLGTLCRPPGGDYAAQYLVPDAGGSISVKTIDSLLLPEGQSLALKLDIEGAELRALQGAAKTLLAAANVVVAIEAHPEVTKRTGIDPSDCLGLLSSSRKFSFIVGETGTSVAPDRPFFEQIAPCRVYNIIGIAARCLATG